MACTARETCGSHEVTTIRADTNSSRTFLIEPAGVTTRTQRMMVGLKNHTLARIIAHACCTASKFDPGEARDQRLLRWCDAPRPLGDEADYPARTGSARHTRDHAPDCLELLREACYELRSSTGPDFDVAVIAECVPLRIDALQSRAHAQLRAASRWIFETPR